MGTEDKAMRAAFEKRFPTPEHVLFNGNGVYRGERQSDDSMAEPHQAQWEAWQAALAAQAEAPKLNRYGHEAHCSIMFPSTLNGPDDKCDCAAQAEAPAPVGEPVASIEKLLEWAVLDGVIGMSKVFDTDLQDALAKFALRFAAPSAQPAQAEPVALHWLMAATAPKRIYLNLFTDEDNETFGFPDDHEGITWAEDIVGDSDVAYIRADLAANHPQATDVWQALSGLDKRPRECMALGLSAAEAYDSGYQEATAESLADFCAAPKPQATGGAGEAQIDVMSCGHAKHLLLISAETGEPLYCEICDLRQQRDDAVLTEQELREQVEQCSRALKEATEPQTFMGEPATPQPQAQGTLSDEAILLIGQRALTKVTGTDAQHIYIAREVERHLQPQAGEREG